MRIILTAALAVKRQIQTMKDLSIDYTSSEPE